MLNFFKKTKKVYYSCVIDDNPKFYWQGYIFVNSLIKLAKVSGDRIFVHMIEENTQFENFLKENDVNVKHIEPWGDKKYCNKLQQLETKELQKADYVFFCDADIAITEDLNSLLDKGADKILGKIVSFDNPSIDKLKQIYDFFKVEYPIISTCFQKDTFRDAETFEGNFNGGLYGIPSNVIKSFSKSWKNFATQMLESKEIESMLEDKINHIDQISFSLALKELNLEYKLLGFEYNCPTHVKNIEIPNSKLTSSAKVIHYHSDISTTGLLNNVNNTNISPIIEKINKALKSDFNNSLFWSYRYFTNPELGSGIGSNDIDNLTVDEALRIDTIDNDLLLESVLVSRNYFNWYTKHYPRLYEYPWILKELGYTLQNLKIADFGAGVTPLPIQLAQRGAEVFTVDKHSMVRKLSEIKDANEWGFLDYGVIDKNITSLNKSLDETTFEESSLDVWYSVSVVEHMPAEIRRMIFSIMAKTLKNGGKLLLTIDLIKDTLDLWNRAEGKEVEDANKHGSFNEFIVELEMIGFKIDIKEVIRMPKDERVDIALISAILNKKTN